MRRHKQLEVSTDEDFGSHRRFWKLISYFVPEPLLIVVGVTLRYTAV